MYFENYFTCKNYKWKIICVLGHDLIDILYFILSKNCLCACVCIKIRDQNVI